MIKEFLTFFRFGLNASNNNILIEYLTRPVCPLQLQKQTPPGQSSVPHYTSTSADSGESVRIGSIY